MLTGSYRFCFFYYFKPKFQIMSDSPIIFNENFSNDSGETVSRNQYLYLLQRYNALFNGNFDIVYLHDEYGNLVDINKAGSKILEYTREEFLQMNLLDLVCPEHHEEIKEIITRVARDGSKGLSREYKVMKKSGEVLWLYTRSNVLINETGKVYIQGFAHDITQRIKYEEDLVKAMKRAEESDLLKSAFLANMSHEIRTPLNAILGFAELISVDELGMEEIKDFSQMIHKNGEYLLNILSDIIDIARIESDQVKINKQKISLCELLKDVESTIVNSHNYKAKPTVDFQIEYKSKDVEIASDIIRLKQVLFNLINNALKFTNEGSVSVGYKVIDGHVQFMVSDTGTGIHKKYHSSIFNRFSQAGSVNQNELGGTGLGLSICKGLVALMDGDIWFESEEGKGSRFFFTVSANQKIQE